MNLVKQRNMTICKLCGLEIKFEINANGRWEPFDLNGVSHFSTCTELKRRRELYSYPDQYRSEKEILQDKLGKEQKFLDEYTKEEKEE